ncbi:MAG: hypothetical protein HQL01_15615 [Nitrospirae bacterium]|nr:hypothetical protein [Nitrospirota bacterium]
MTRAVRTILLRSIFALAKKEGIDSGDLRDTYAVMLLKKRLSEATAKELESFRRMVFYRGAKPKRYESSRAGLIEELEDAAKRRWGASFKDSLNAFCNSRRKVKTHYTFLSVADLKQFKEKIKELTRDEGQLR